MENNNNQQTFVTGENSGVILGTSSDAIIEGLHQGDFVEGGPAGALPDDDDKIVNQQDQQEIVNPQEKDYVEGEAEGGVASVTGTEEDGDDEDICVDDDLAGEDSDTENTSSGKTE
jgi:hypothetical protein